MHILITTYKNRIKTNWWNVFMGCTIIFISSISCNKKASTNDFVKLRDIYPLQVGKTFLYRMDSTMPNSDLSQLITKSFLAKDSVESTFKDNTGRQSFRIFRYLTDTLYTQPWQFSKAFYATFDSTYVEFNDNNLHFITLAMPVSSITNWNGTSKINTTDGGYQYMNGWNFGYQNLGQPYSVLKGKIPNTYTVVQKNSVTQPNFDKSFYATTDYSIEIYAKGIGLIYKEFLHWTWQPLTGYTTNEDYDGVSCGIKLNLIDYK